MVAGDGGGGGWSGSGGEGGDGSWVSIGEGGWDSGGRIGQRREESALASRDERPDVAWRLPRAFSALPSFTASSWLISYLLPCG